MGRLKELCLDANANGEAVLRLVEAHSLETAVAENFDAAGERMQADKDSEQQVVVILVNYGLADGEAVMAIDIRGPVLGTRYSVVSDQFGQVLAGGTRRLVGLAGPTVGILHPNQVELVPRIFHLDKLEFTLTYVGGGVEDAAADEDVVAGEDVYLSVCQLDSPVPAKTHQDRVLVRVIMEGGSSSRPQLQFPDIIEVIGIDPVFPSPGFGDQFIKEDILGKAFIAQQLGNLVYRPGDRDAVLAGFELALELGERAVGGVKSTSEDSRDVKRGRPIACKQSPCVDDINSERSRARTSAVWEG